MRSSLMQCAVLLVSVFVLSSCGGDLVRATEDATSAEVLRAVNYERSKRGLVKVVPNAALRKLAMEHGRFLVAKVHPTQQRPRRGLAHAGFASRAEQANAQKYRVLSEVVMIGARGDLSAVTERTIKGWMNSPLHRKAILNEDRRVMGIETRLPADGRYFVVGLLSNGREK